MHRLPLLSLALGCALAAAGPALGAPPTEFPAAAGPLEAAALDERVRGRVFTADAADGKRWRMEYTRGGHLFVNVYPSFADDGPFEVQGSQVCVTLKKSGASCSEYRSDAGGTLYLKRASNGEILTLRPD